MGYARAVRNLPAFPRVRKVLRLLLWGGGAAGWVAVLWLRFAVAGPPPVEIERGGATLGPLWEPDCPPVVASSRGSRYYWGWCEGAGALKPANLRHFCGADEAEAAGFSPAKGCGEGGGGGRRLDPENTLIFDGST